MLRNSCIRIGGLAMVSALSAVGLAACGAAPADGEVQQSAALTDNSLTANSLTANALTDPLARELLKYVVSCALDDGDSLTIKVNGTRYTFPGELGLAPDWSDRDGSCDGSCQRWVTACVLARVDAAGVKREISVRGNNPALWPSFGELWGYPAREASYFGNIFAPGQPRFLCLSPGQTNDPRVCGASLASCPMTVEGSCSTDCSDTGAFGTFSNCSDAGRAGRGHTYAEVITVFLPLSGSAM